MSGRNTSIELKSPTMTRATPIAWVDIETTGTVVERHAILSIGVVRSDGAEREWYIRAFPGQIQIASPEASEDAVRGDHQRRRHRMTSKTSMNREVTHV